MMELENINEKYLNLLAVWRNGSSPTNGRAVVV